MLGLPVGISRKQFFEWQSSRPSRPPAGTCHTGAWLAISQPGCKLDTNGLKIERSLQGFA